MEGSTQVKSQMPAPNVTKYLTRMAVIKSMKGSTREKSSFPVQNVTMVLSKRAHLKTHKMTHTGTWKNMKGPKKK